jgi:uncharacterized membrane protein YvlD (DUF360 family)
MFSALLSLLINTAAFYGISRILPGFRIKDEKTAAIVAVAYSILGYIASLLAMPLLLIGTLFLTLLAFIPIIGPLLAGAGFFVTVFLLTFGLSVILLMVIDKVLDDFEMDSTATAIIASFLLAAINVGAQLVLPL